MPRRVQAAAGRAAGPGTMSRRAAGGQGAPATADTEVTFQLPTSPPAKVKSRLSMREKLAPVPATCLSPGVALPARIGRGCHDNSRRTREPHAWLRSRLGGMRYWDRNFLEK